MIHICIFFFKQKTAYEMRISDWSSDVCSSDLVGGQGKLQPSGVTRTLNGHDQGLRKTGETIDDAGLEIMRIAFLADHTKIHAGTKRPSFSTQDDTADRKSVVSGKSVSVRVDLGGRRIIKKKTKEKNIRQRKNRK